MTDTMTNPLRESSGTLEQAAEAFGNILTPQEPKGQPEKEDREESNAEVDTEADESEVEELDDSQPEAEEEDAETEEEDSSDEVDAEDDQEVFVLGDEEVTAKQILEWKSRGMMEADYRQKTQALAEERRAFEAEKTEELGSLRSEYEKKLAAFADVTIDELKQFENLDWDALKESDPYSYNQKWVDFQRAQVRAAQTGKAIQEEMEKARQEADSARKTRLAETAKTLPKLIPEFGDPVKAKALLSEMSEYLSGKGMSAEAMSSIEDPVAYAVIHDALQWNKLNGKVKNVKKSKVSPVKKVIKPGSTSSKATVVERDVKARQQKLDRLRNSGRIEDAADFF